MKGFQEQKKNITNEWYTPPEVFELLKFPEFDLDPASPGKSVVKWIPAKEHYTESGLLREWHGRVWLNPPYGNETAIWLNKLALHGNGIALVFARTDTLWFHTTACKADAICFLNGRIRFIDKDGKQGDPATCGSMLLAWGNECADILVGSGVGWCVDNRPQSKPTKTEAIRAIDEEMEHVTHDREGLKELARVAKDYIAAM